MFLLLNNYLHSNMYLFFDEIKETFTKSYYFMSENTFRRNVMKLYIFVITFTLTHTNIIHPWLR